MSNTGWFDSQTRSTGANVGVKTGKNTDYGIISRYNQMDTALVVQVFRTEDDVRNIKQSGVVAQIGAILCVPENKNAPGNKLAYPLNANINQYPAEGEYVRIGSFGGDNEIIFYEPIATQGNVNYNGNPNKLVRVNRKNINPQLNEGEELVDTSTSFRRKDQFKLRPFTSDLIIQSRFGSNIRMTDLKANDPTEVAPTLILSNNISPSPTGLEESLNKQGSYLILTNDDSSFLPPVFQDFVKSNLITRSGYEEINTYRQGYLVNRSDGAFLQEQFITGSSVFPNQLTGDRIILSSNTIITESTGDDTFILSDQNIALFSKKATSIDAMGGMNINTARSSFRIKGNNVYINSPNIFLGHEENRSQPAVLGENLLTFLELVIGSLKQFMDLNYIFDDANYTSPGQSEESDNMRNAFKELVTNGRIPEDFRKNLLSDKVFIAPNRVDPQVDPPVRGQYDLSPGA